MRSPDESAARQGRAIDIRPLLPYENSLVPQLWNRAWSAGTALHGHNPYPLNPALWRERLASRHHDQSLLLGAFVESQLIAVAYAKLAVSPWQARDTGWLALLCVEPPWQGKGIGTRLAAVTVRALQVRGCSHLRFGSEADHFLPGLPQEAGTVAWRLTRRLGGVPSNTEHDLLLDLRTTLPSAPLPPGFRLRDDRAESGLAFVAQTFPGRWAEEVRDYIAGGATVITIERDGGDDVMNSAPAQGFCMVFQGSERVTSPGLLWSDALVAELGQASTRLAGIGPLGVSPDVRGAGAGLALVRGAAAWLQERGHTDAVINWTTLTSFYGRLGARVWRSYQRVQANLAPLAGEATSADDVHRDGEPSAPGQHAKERTS
ncbi:MAG TPA: GNAT family N-acetyltransferase [Trueperaceae bacterium]|nr:GNAT family N-acetyltransferase [Trueperaceae bacterium]